MFSTRAVTPTCCEPDRLELASLDVLVLDCQSTGAHPACGSLLELGWGVTHAAAAAGTCGVVARLVALPAGEEIPRRVAALTGLSEQDVARGASGEAVWHELARAARAVAARCRLERAPTVIHYARFEVPFLRSLQERHEPAGEFPLDIVCVHELATRLLPGLPRRSLRGLAGFYGHGVPAERRSASHVVATATVWRELVALLARETGVASWRQLQRWLARPRSRRAVARAYPLARDRRLALPCRPGVYRMMRRGGDVLYVGKARSLRARVNSYFRQRKGLSERALEMLTQAHDVEVVETATALEAALLEADEIKRLAPAYNVRLRSAGREVWYGDGDLGSFRPAPDALHRVGPLGSPAPLAAMGALQAMLRVSDGARDVEREVASVLGVPVDRAPESDCWRAGVEQFTRLHPAAVAAAAARPSWWMSLGAELWRERQAEAARHEVEATEAEQPGPAQGPGDPWDPTQGWDPDRVARSLAGVVRRAAHAVRRAHWLCRLFDSVIQWSPGDGKGWRVLVVRGGQVAERSWWTAGGSRAPVRCEWSRRRDEPPTLDVCTFDRLQVLTTELKLLVSAGGEVELWCGPRDRLVKERLIRSLGWV